MKFLNFRLFILVSFIFPHTASFGSVGEIALLQDTILYNSPFKEDNERCFKCHGQKKYEYPDDRQKKIAMYPDGIITSREFYNSNHKSFSCTDCHSSEFVSFPHPEELKTEMHFNCMDCHGDDPAYAMFRFEEIDTEYRKSVHFSLEEKGFNCWQCHDPHSYRLTARNSDNLKEIVMYDNAICLDCHSDYDRFRLFSDRDKTNLTRIHKWLPHHATHFMSVRCIDCHTEINKNLLVSHNVVPEDDAIRDCKKCHSGNSSAMTLLLRTQSKSPEELNDDTYINGLNIIGPNRSKYLNNLSLIVFTVVMAIIGIHILFRVIRK